MHFSLGNSQLKKNIHADILSGNFPHALLVSGPKDVGKFSFLVNAAKELLKDTKPIPPSLVIIDMLYMEGSQSDMEVIAKFSNFDQSHRKKKKVRSNSLGIEDIEVGTKHLHETVMGEYKIVVIRDIERMTIAASNKFLKILEEPPQKTLFFLTTSASQKILSTIISRCRVEHFSLLSPQEIQIEIAQDQRFFSENEKQLLHVLSSGKSEVLLKMMNDAEFFTEKKEEYAKVKEIMSSTNLEKMTSAELLAKQPLSEIYSLLEYFLIHYRPLLAKDNKNISALEKIDKTISLLQKNGNKRLVLESLFLSL